MRPETSGTPLVISHVLPLVTFNVFTVHFMVQVERWSNVYVRIQVIFFEQYDLP